MIPEAAEKDKTLLDTPVSLFRGSTNTTPVETLPLAAVLQRIQDGTYQPCVERLRQQLAQGDKAGYDQAKRRSDAFTPAGVFAKRANAKLLTPSGLLNFDFDQVPDLADAKTQLAQDPWVVYAFVSPGGAGLKVAVWADGIADAVTYTHAWGTVRDYFERTYPDIAAANDKACKDVSRLCYVSDDPDLYSNPNARLYAVPRFQAPAPKLKPRPQSTNAPAPSTPHSHVWGVGAGGDPRARVEEALRHIPADDRGDWLTVGMALQASGEAWARALWDTWSATSAKYDAADQDYTWQSFKPNGGVTLGSLFHLAEHYGYSASAPTATASSAAGIGSGTPPVWGTPGQQTSTTWTQHLLCNKSGTPQQTIRNFVLAIQNLDPWKSAGCWYDAVRERHMIGDKPVEDGDATVAGILIEQATEIRVTNIPLVGRALDYVCRRTTRDLLQEWVATLQTVPPSNLLTTWLRTYAHVPDTVSDAYVADVSRLIPVSMIARILHPGCQYRFVPILEGPENAGKSKLTKALAGADAYGRNWHVALSAGMEGKEAHMMLAGALIAELEELSSYTKTDENRMKALITAETDSFVPKFANKRADHPRRTVFLATVNPESDGQYLKGQSGNTRFLPLQVGTIDIPGFLTVREQLFAEAKAYYLAHPGDWWQLDCEVDAHEEREERRQTSVYEGESLRQWLSLRRPAECTWQEVAELHLNIPKDRWTKALQMELGKALRASGWVPQRITARRYWVPG